MPKWNKTIIIALIQDFYKTNNRSPIDKDFYKHTEYPSPTTVKKYFGTWNNALLAADVPVNRYKKINNYWTKDLVVEKIKQYYGIHNKIPELRDFIPPDYPSHMVVIRLFNTWNNAIESAGFEPNTQNSLGVNTKALDGYTYRSKAEAYFVDTYLYNKYTYDVEPKYPEPYNLYYDWYVHELNLFIELDGGIRPEVSKQKVIINNKIDHKCLFIQLKDLKNIRYINELMDNYSI